MKIPILLLLASVLLCGCSKPTEEERLEKFRGSMKYKAYRFTSEQTTKLAVAEYNRSSAQPVTDATIHPTIGLLWFLAGKSEYSFIESDIAATGATNDTRMLCLALQSVALSKMKFPNLAKSYYDQIKTTLAAEQGTDTESMEVAHKLMLVSLIAVSLQQGDLEFAQFAADALGAVSQLDYLSPLVGAIVESKKGSPLNAVAKLRELNKSEHFSEHKKAIIAEVADIIANCPENEKLADEVMNRVVMQLFRRVFDDIFSTEDQRLLLQKVKTLPDVITGNTSAQPSSAGDVQKAAPEK